MKPFYKVTMRIVFIILFPLLILFGSCSDKKAEATEKLSVVDERWTQFNTKDSIPDALKTYLIRLNNGSFVIANPDERFNAADVMNDSIPNRKLNLLSKKGNSWRLSYIQGGFGKYYVYTQCEIEKDSVYDFQIAESLWNLDNNDSIDRYILDKKIVFKDVKY